MEVLLDSNFIISCIKRKIDIFQELEGLGFRIIVPREVLEELKDLKARVPPADRQAIGVAFELFEKRKVEKMRMPRGSVDEGLIALGKKGAYIATLDAGIKRLIPNTIGIDNARNSFIVSQG